MVCHGPSKGCTKCRQRKIKCDERRPGCRNCEKSKRECPGYDRGERFMSFGDQSSTVSTSKDSQPSSGETVTYEHVFPATTGASTESGRTLATTAFFKQAPKRRRSPSPSSSSFSSLRHHGVVNDEPFPSADFDMMLKRPDTAPLDIANEFIPLGLPQDPDQQSLSFFMTNFALSQNRAEEIWGGFLETLPSVLVEAPSESPLAAAASTTAMASIAWTPGYSDYSQDALSKYVTSLRRISAALKDPKQAESDNLLMAVLMLGFYENIKTLTLQRSDREAHIRGAVALIKTRKPGSFRNQDSLRLYLAVRAQLLNLCIEKCDPAPFEDFDAATVGTLPEDFEPSCADRLVMLSQTLPNLLNQEQSIMSESDVLKRRILARTLLTDAMHMQETLSYWASLVPSRLQPIPIQLPKYEKKLPADPDVYPANMDIYCDNTMASTWNTWRVTRIRVLRIIMNCVNVSSPSHPAIPRPAEYESALSMILKLLSDICSSIPFYLGFHEHRFGESGAFTIFPHPPGEAKWPDNFAASGAVGGWLMMQPLSFVARLEYTPESMRAWVREYMTTFLRDPVDMRKGPMSPLKS